MTDESSSKKKRTTRKSMPVESPERGRGRPTRPPGTRLTPEAERQRARPIATQPTEPPNPRFPSGPLSFANLRAPSAVPPADQGTRSPASSVPSSPTNIESEVLGKAIERGRKSSPEITERTIDDPISEMRERSSLGDYSGALEMAELILAADPNNLEAATCREACRSVLEKMYSARLGPGNRVPVVIVPRSQMQWLAIDHRAGFVLSLIDGSSTIEMIIDVSGMPRLDALGILNELVQQHIVSFR